MLPTHDNREVPVADFNEFDHWGVMIEREGHFSIAASFMNHGVARTNATNGVVANSKDSSVKDILKFRLDQKPNEIEVEIETSIHAPAEEEIFKRALDTYFADSTGLNVCFSYAVEP